MPPSSNNSLFNFGFKRKTSATTGEELEAAQKERVAREQADLAQQFNAECQPPGQLAPDEKPKKKKLRL